MSVLRKEKRTESEKTFSVRFFSLSACHSLFRPLPKNEGNGGVEDEVHSPGNGVDKVEKVQRGRKGEEREDPYRTQNAHIQN